MNYLSHHAVALDNVGATEPADLYIGNVLPDLIATSGEGRLRPHQPITGTPSLMRGIGLHFETDRRFHALPAFAQAREVAKSLLAAIPFAVVPPRAFFLAHVAVEICLDGLLLHTQPHLASDFYDRFAAADMAAVLAQSVAMLRLEGPPLALARTFDRFAESRYLFRYAEADGQAEAMIRLYRRIGVEEFAKDPEDRRRLNGFFASLACEIAPLADRLLLRSAADRPVVK